MTGAYRRTAAVLLSGLLIAGLGACGGDDDDTDASDSGSGTTEGDSGLDAAAPTAAADFCEGFHNLDLAFAEAPEDPAELEAFVTEEVTPNVALVEANAPTEIDASITTMVGAVEEVTASGDFSAFETPEFTAAQEDVYPYLPEGCGWAPMETTAVDYSYEGMPETVEAGTVVITMANDSAAGEPHELGLVKLTDAAADLTVEELLALPEAEQEQYFDMETPGAHLFAAPGATGGVTADLTPGRYAYACFVPAGTTMDTEGTGQPHFMEGMFGELTVT
jgi:hypothetical protein